MIIALSELSKDVVRNIAEAHVLEEGTDYGEIEMAFADKVEQVLVNLQSGNAVIVYSELHETVSIRPADDYRNQE